MEKKQLLRKESQEIRYQLLKRNKRYPDRKENFYANAVSELTFKIFKTEFITTVYLELK